MKTIGIKPREFFGDSVALVSSGGAIVLEVYETRGEMPRRFKLKRTEDYVNLARKQQKFVSLGMGLIPELTERARKKQNIQTSNSSENPTIEQAIFQYIQSISLTCSERYVKNSADSGRYISNWFKSNFQNVVLWRKIEKRHFLEFAQLHKHLTNAGFSNYRKIYAGVSKLMWQKFDIPNVWEKSEIIFRGEKSREKCDVLRFDQLKMYFENVDKTSPLYPISVLMALAGLRTTEATHIRTMDVNLTEKTIAITDTEFHAVKNENARRTIPISESLCDFLRPFLKPENPLEPLFLSSRGQVFSLGSDALRLATRKFIKQLREKSLVPAAFTFHEFRACFITSALYEALVPESFLQVFVGHASVSGATLRYARTSQIVAELRKNVVSYIEPKHEIFRACLLENAVKLDTEK